MNVGAEVIVVDDDQDPSEDVAVKTVINLADDDSSSSSSSSSEETDGSAPTKAQRVSSNSVRGDALKSIFESSDEEEQDPRLFAEQVTRFIYVYVQSTWRHYLSQALANVEGSTVDVDGASTELEVLIAKAFYAKDEEIGNFTQYCIVKCFAGREISCLNSLDPAYEKEIFLDMISRMNRRGRVEWERQAAYGLRKTLRNTPFGSVPVEWRTLSDVDLARTILKTIYMSNA